MKKKIFAICLIVATMFCATGCDYDVELNWPIEIHRKTEAPQPTPMVIYVPSYTMDPDSREN